MKRAAVGLKFLTVDSATGIRFVLKCARKVIVARSGESHDIG